MKFEAVCFRLNIFVIDIEDGSTSSLVLVLSSFHPNSETPRRRTLKLQGHVQRASNSDSCPFPELPGEPETYVSEMFPTPQGRLEHPIHRLTKRLRSCPRPLPVISNVPHECVGLPSPGFLNLRSSRTGLGRPRAPPHRLSWLSFIAMPG